MSEHHSHARAAAAALLRMAKAASDPQTAAGLVAAAAQLKEQAGELPADCSGGSLTVRTIDVAGSSALLAY